MADKPDTSKPSDSKYDAFLCGADSLSAHGIEPEAAESALLAYGRDLTELAAEGQFDNLEDREDIQSIIEGLCGCTRRNVLLLAHAGCGKTAAVEKLAQRIVTGDVPQSLQDSKIIEISLVALTAGTRYRGDFEKRMVDLLNEVAKDENANTILFFDEAHLLTSAGAAMKIDTTAANSLKPIMARGDIRIIAATTLDEYRNSIDKDPAFRRRFSLVKLEEPAGKLLHAMIRKQADQLQAHHGIRIPDALIPFAIDTADRCLQGHQPDKSVALLDRCAARAALQRRETLTRPDVLAFVGESERPAFTHASLLADLNANLIGQGPACEQVAATLVTRAVGLGHNRNRNWGEFLLLGATGIGKTELAKQVARACFGSETKLFIIDMGGLQASSALNRLIGSDTGYLGSERDGSLVRFLKGNDSRRVVLLFDEVEKCHPDLLPFLLSILDEGRLQTGTGEEIILRQSIVIMTSNAVRQKDLNRMNVGFARDTSSAIPHDLLQDFFPPEFLGRTEIILMNDIGADPAAIRGIIALKWRKTRERLQRNGLQLEVDRQAMLAFLERRLKYVRGGARDILRVIETAVEQPIAIAAQAHTARPLKLQIDSESLQHDKLTVSASPSSARTKRQLQPA